MKSHILLCMVALLVCVVFVSGCTTVFNELGIKTGGTSGDSASKAAGYGSPGGAGDENQTTPPEPETPPAADPDWVVAGMNTCWNDKAILVELPVANGDFLSITPLGNLNPPGHTFPTDHVYFMLQKLNQFAAAQAYVVSPADARVTRIVSSEHISDNFTDYAIDFSPCRELVFRFGHMSSISETLATAMANATASCEPEYETGGKRFRNCAADVMVQVSASEVIGTAGGNVGQFALDMWAFDSRTSGLNYANKARWYDQQMHAVCPLNYFKTELKDLLELMLMSEGGAIRTIPPLCGEVEQDEAGTAQGVWFAKSTTNTYPEDPHAALVRDNFDPSLGAFSIGTSMQASGLAPNVYYFQPTDIDYVNRGFAGIRADGKIYCYDTRADDGKKNVVILQLTSATTLRMERVNAETCSISEPWAFSDNAGDFER